LQGYQSIDLVDDQEALVAKPEKALLDLIYLTPGGDRPDYLQELRLQNLGLLNMEELHRQSTTFATPKLERAVKVIEQLEEQESRDFEN
jgi:hypothetical protein